MDADKQPAQDAPAAGNADSPQPDGTVPADALSKPEASTDSETIDATSGGMTEGPAAGNAAPAPPKKPGGFKAFLRRFNIYFLLFLLVVVVAAVVAAVGYLNSRKPPTTPDLTSQTLTPDTLKQLANSDATVGDSGQTLTVQGNAVFDGQVLVRSNLNVAGTIQLGGPLNISNLIVSDTANLANTQVNSLQVANGSTFQGTVTVQHDLNVGGTTAFSGPVTAGQITVTKLIMSGNAQLQVPNHVAFIGASPGRTIGNALGGGGSTSVYGSDTSGTINVNTGNNPSPGCFATITFNQKFASTPHVLISPVGAAAGLTQYYVKRDTTSFSVCTDNAAPANQIFAFDYFVTA